MQNFFFTPDAISGVNIQLVQKVDLVDPETAQVTPGTVPVNILDDTNGFIGVFPHKTKLQLRLEIKGEHRCYVLDPDTKAKIAKKVDSPGKYSKNFSISVYQDKFLDEKGMFVNKDNKLRYSGIEGGVAQWPANMICLEVPGHTYNIGILCQNGRFFFTIEEYLPDPKNLLEGMVIWFSLLRGYGAVAYKPTFDSRVYWKNLRFNRYDGLRILRTGDLLEWNPENVVDLDGDTSFRYEIKLCVNLSASK